MLPFTQAPDLSPNSALFHLMVFCHLRSTSSPHIRRCCIASLPAVRPAAARTHFFSLAMDADKTRGGWPQLTTSIRFRFRSLLLHGENSRSSTSLMVFRSVAGSTACMPAANARRASLRANHIESSDCGCHYSCILISRHIPSIIQNNQWSESSCRQWLGPRHILLRFRLLPGTHCDAARLGSRTSQRGESTR
ncbi:hypothetical protein C8R47DRAFT_129435 [Mycena vitilis]|nr:hypothetical protein C8R47DRAFT_129435 [Mycena vitilis]